MNAVLITGASSGIGLAAAVALAARNFTVFAGVRTLADQGRLEGLSPNIKALILDISVPAHIEHAFDRIQKESLHSFHLVNNAGIVVPGPIEILPLSDLRRQFDVNVFGLIEVTQIFLPLLRQHRGRVLLIGSISGLASSPFVGAYAASKFALEALADSLRWELAPSGIKVILIQPGAVATPIWKKGLLTKDDFKGSLTPALQSYYGDAIARFEGIIQAEEDAAIPVGRVTLAIVKSLTAARPAPRLKVVSLSRNLQLFFLRYFPQSWVDGAVRRKIFKS